MPESSVDSGMVFLVAAVTALTVLSIVLAYLYTTARRSLRQAERVRDEAAAEASVVNTRLEEREKTLAEMQTRAHLLERNLMAATEDKAGLAAQVATLEKSRREQIEMLEKADVRLREAFGALSRDALDRNNRMFIDLAKSKLGEFNQQAKAELEARKTAVDAMVKPIDETLKRMDRKLEEAEKTRKTDHDSLIAVQNKLSETTGHLVRALHHSSSRGRWGELQLRRVVEMAGMLEYCDFDEQVTVTGDGKRQRPDMVIRLVGGRSIVVDAKAPMESYLQACECESELLEKELRQRHADAVRSHMRELGSKGYWRQFDNTPDFVVMFFPNEAAFADAMRADADLMDFSVDNRVIPASPATLIALLKAAAYGWRQERMAENAREIIDMGHELHARFASAYKHIYTIGTHLGRTVDAFNNSVGSAERKLFPWLRRFTEKVEKDQIENPQPIEKLPRSPVRIEMENPPADDSRTLFKQ